MSAVTVPCMMRGVMMRAVMMRGVAQPCLCPAHPCPHTFRLPLPLAGDEHDPRLQQRHHAARYGLRVGDRGGGWAAATCCGRRATPAVASCASFIGRGCSLLPALLQLQHRLELQRARADIAAAVLALLHAVPSLCCVVRCCAGGAGSEKESQAKIKRYMTIMDSMTGGYRCWYCHHRCCHWYCWPHACL